MSEPSTAPAAAGTFPVPPVEIEIAVEAEIWQPSAEVEATIHRAVAAAVVIGELDLPEEAELSVVLTDDARIRDLNRVWRGFDKPTNVLSFPGSDADDDDPEPLIGDIVISHETTAREAAEEGKPFLDHVAHLVVHGLLHLFGYDHLEDDEAEAMEALEVEILAGLGVADPYADLGPGAAHRPVDAA